MSELFPVATVEYFHVVRIKAPRHSAHNVFCGIAHWGLKHGNCNNKVIRWGIGGMKPVIDIAISRWKLCTGTLWTGWLNGCRVDSLLVLATEKPQCPMVLAEPRFFCCVLIAGCTCSCCSENFLFIPCFRNGRRGRYISTMSRNLILWFVTLGSLHCYLMWVRFGVPAVGRDKGHQLTVAVDCDMPYDTVCNDDFQISFGVSTSLRPYCARRAEMTVIETFSAIRSGFCSLRQL